MTFRAWLYIRTILLVLNLVLVVWGFTEQNWYLMSSILTVVALLQLYSLNYFIQKTNRDLARFLEGMINKDATLHFNDTKWKSGFDELMHSFNTLSGVYRKARIDKEIQYQYFKKMIEQIDTGIISIQSNGCISLMNGAAVQLLDIPEQRNLETLQKKAPLLVEVMTTLKPGESKLIEYKKGVEVKQLKVALNEIFTKEDQFKIVSFQNIRSEMELNEMQSWHKLIRVLTHEIMNSVTPITTLSETVKMILEKEEGVMKSIEELDNEDVMDIQQSVNTIGRRSQGLLHFVSDYRKLTKVAKPHKVLVDIQELFTSLVILYQNDFKKNSIKVTWNVQPEKLTVFADQNLLEQVIINLLLNAIEAIEDQAEGEITLEAIRRENKTIIEVCDNGKGIPEHIQPQIFIPFYSTKEKGSGIGLSLSRNVIRMHGGRLYFNSTQEKTSFFIEL